MGSGISFPQAFTDRLRLELGVPPDVKPDGLLDQLGKNIQGEIIDPVKEEGSRIESKSRAELKRIPDNIDKATEKVKETVRDTLSDIVGGIIDIVPGLGALSTFVKIAGIGVIAIIGLSIIRRVGKQ